MAICMICNISFEARHSYGLCASCFSPTLAREFDRLENAKYKAQKQGLAATLTLNQLLSVVSDFKGLCAWCQEYTYSIIEIVDPAQGLTYDNTAPCCRACSHHRRYGIIWAENRVMEYLQSERTPQDIAQNEEEINENDIV